MICTEDEAKTKWCPFARIWTGEDAHSPQAVGWNRMPRGGSTEDSNAFKAGCEMRETNCIGSACMAWRWGDNINIGHGGHKTVQRGYCGLAGRPE